MKRTAPRRNSAFTLIELLVVIAIIGILAAALFPAVSGAILRAQATAFSNRARNIVMAVINANLERERDMLGVLWPHNQAGDPNFPRIGQADSATDWVQKMVNPTAGRRQLEGVDLSMFAGGGVPAPNTDQIADVNLAWGFVFNLLETDSENALFMVTRNTDFTFEPAEIGDRQYHIVASASIDSVDPQRAPFGDKMIVFARKGGSSVSIRPDLLHEVVVIEGRDDSLVPAGAMSTRTEMVYPTR